LPSRLRNANQIEQKPTFVAYGLTMREASGDQAHCPTDRVKESREALPEQTSQLLIDRGMNVAAKIP
jgi:hypothetical protein